MTEYFCVFDTNHGGLMARKIFQKKAEKIINDKDNTNVFVFSTTSDFKWSLALVPVEEGTISKLFHENENVRPWIITNVDVVAKYYDGNLQYIKLIPIKN